MACLVRLLFQIGSIWTVLETWAVSRIWCSRRRASRMMQVASMLHADCSTLKVRAHSKSRSEMSQKLQLVRCLVTRPKMIQRLAPDSSGARPQCIAGLTGQVLQQRRKPAKVLADKSRLLVRRVLSLSCCSSQAPLSGRLAPPLQLRRDQSTSS